MKLFKWNCLTIGKTYKTYEEFNKFWPQNKMLNYLIMKLLNINFIKNMADL